MLTTEQAAHATGMKIREIVDVKRIDGGYRVTTHDGQHVDLDAGGPEPKPAEASKPAEEKKPAAARSRGRS